MKPVHLIGNAHLDPVWLWQWHEGYMEVKATFRSALDRMKEFPDLIFTSACAAYYEWVRDSDPAMFEEIRQRVAEGRWQIVGGWYIQPDCNIPCGESFARHALVSQRFFRETLGVTAKTGYNVDSFGHNGSLPMILKQSGMDNYVFMRPQAHEKEIPDEVFLWESADGSLVQTYRIPIQYNFNLGCYDNFARVAEMATKHEMMAFYGIGNHGGGPTTELLYKMHETLDAETYIYSSVDKYFERVKHDALITVRDDLQYHAKGCYSACAMIKANNRKSENMLLATEAYSTLSRQLLGTPYPTDELMRGWKNTLFNQFHDILGGCSIKEAYDDAAMQHGETQSIADRNANFALQQISWNIDTIGENPVQAKKPGWGAAWYAEGIGTPIVLFNPHAWDVTAFVRVGAIPTRLTDKDGRSVPMQRIRASKTNGSRDLWEAGFVATIPALGYTVYRAYYEGEEETYTNPFTTGNDFIENDRLRLCFDTVTGELVSMIDRASGRDFLDGATGTVLMDEADSDTWAHGITAFKKVADIFTTGEVRVIEEGPLRVTMRSTVRGAKSTVIRDYSLIAGSDTVTVKTKIDFHEQHRMLKFTIPVRTTKPTVLCAIPFGTIERPTDGMEQVCQAWFAMGDGADSGLAVLNDSKYSFDAEGNTLSLTVLRGAIFADHYGTRDEFCPYMEQGVHSFTYALCPFTSVADTTRRAAELNTAPFVVQETFHRGTLGLSYSGIAVDADNIIVTAVKKHTDSDAIVVRAYECEGRDTTATLCVFGTRFTADFGHNAVKTFVITDSTARETDFLED